MSLVRLAALPDELAPGYEGRVLRFNGWTDRKQAMSWLLAWSGSQGTSRREVPTVDLLARVAGSETPQFVQDHTTLPMRRAVTSLMPGIPHGCQSNSTVLWTMAMRATRLQAYFCVECVKEDLDFHGTPYWRRSQQLQGAFWCQKHGSPFSFVEGKSAFATSPTAFIEHRHVVSDRWVETLKSCAPILRFHAICADLLARTRSLDEEAVSKAARARAQDTGLHVGRGTVRNGLLSDLIKRKFNRKWLDSVIPGLTDKPLGEFWQTVDGALLGKRAGVSSVVYALTFAVLFDSADEAVNAIVAPRVEEPADRSRSRDEPCATDDQLRAAFVASMGSHADAAVRVRLRRDEATRRLTKLGLPSLRRLDGDKFKAVMSSILDGRLTLEQACKSHGLSSKAVATALKQAMSPLTAALAEMGPKQARAVRAKRRPVAPPRQIGVPLAAGALPFDLRSQTARPGRATTAGVAKPVAT
jgi:hypothetical protein